MESSEKLVGTSAAVEMALRGFSHTGTCPNVHRPGLMMSILHFPFSENLTARVKVLLPLFLVRRPLAQRQYASVLIRGTCTDSTKFSLYNPTTCRSKILYIPCECLREEDPNKSRRREAMPCILGSPAPQATALRDGHLLSPCQVRQHPEALRSSLQCSRDRQVLSTADRPGPSRGRTLCQDAPQGRRQGSTPCQASSTRCPSLPPPKTCMS